MKIFVDTNICFDFLGKREPFFEPARQLFSLSEQGKFDLAISSVSFTTLDYLISSNWGSAESFKRLRRFRALIELIAVDHKTIDLALASNFKDFEDAVQYYAALSCDAKVILTRNQNDFTKAHLPVHSAEEFLKNFT